MKRRIFLALLCLMILLSMTIPAFADSTATGVQNYANVTSEGNCEVALTVSLHLEEAIPNLAFPLPATATNIKMDGGNAKITRTAGAAMADLSHLGEYIGDTVVRFTYTIPNVVSVLEGKLYLNLPLLSGFDYPIESMRFDLMLPGKITSRPTFTSTYHQDSIESILTYVTDESMLSGTIHARLKDNETLAINLEVTPAMFPGVSTYERTGNPEYVPMGIFAGLAFLYWILFLRALPILRIRRTTPPEGITAGELGTRLTLCGADLTMMVVSWAQLG